MSKQDSHNDDRPTTGHEWDGIREYDNPLPRWWLWTFYATILWGIAYTVAYPAWPYLGGDGKATPGVLGYASRADVAADIQRYNDANSAVDTKLASVELSAIAGDAELKNYAMNGGAAVFKTWCAQCHGAGAGGFVGYPNLLDNDWLWGGSIEDIHTTISHGIREDSDDDTRYSEMPKFGEFLEKAEIGQLVQYVLALSGKDHDAVQAASAQELYVDNCESCHGEGGKGDRDQGAPNLTDAIWLYGGDSAALTASITNARFGAMPAWYGRLSESQIRQVATWVHQQGGGE